MIRRPPRSTQSRSSAASDVYKRQAAAQAPDRVGIVLVGVAIGWFLYRQATVCAVADGDGVAVRNLVVSRRVEWAEIVSVRFGEAVSYTHLTLPTIYSV